MDQNEFNSGVVAFKAGNKQLARNIFSEITEKEPSNEIAWLWLAASAENDKEKKACLLKVLAINPDNVNAQKALTQLDDQQIPSLDEIVTPSKNPSSVKQPQSDSKAGSTISIVALKCPMCGGNVGSRDRECSYCGSALIIVSIEKTFSLKIDSQVLSSSVSKWRDVLKTDPENPEAHYGLGLTYLNQQLRGAALQHLQKASLLAPESPVIHYNLALTLFNDGNTILVSEYENAVKEIDYSIRLDPHFQEALAFKHFFIARKLGDVDTSEAIKEYEAAIQACSDIAVFHNNLGLSYSRLQNYSMAEKCYLKAIDVDSEYCIAYSNMSLLYFTTGRYAEGIKCGEKAVELLRPAMGERTQAIAYNNLSLSLWKTGQNEAAIQAIKRALASCPQDSQIQANLQNYQRNPQSPPKPQEYLNNPQAPSKSQTAQKNNLSTVQLVLLVILIFLVILVFLAFLASH